MTTVFIYIGVAWSVAQFMKLVAWLEGEKC